jgi:hypothetical protein
MSLVTMRRTALALLALVAVAIARPAAGDSQNGQGSHVIDGGGTASITLAVGGPLGSWESDLVETTEYEGVATHVGRFTLTVVATTGAAVESLDGANGIPALGNVHLSIVEGVLVAANGDRIELRSGLAFRSADDVGNTWAERGLWSQLRVVGGTGRFEGATGDALLVAEGREDGASSLTISLLVSAP